MKTIFALPLLVLALLTACGTNEYTGPDAHEEAIEFFDRLYNQRDLEGAAQLATPSYRETLLRYGTVNSVGRYLYNMNFDEVDIEADRQGISLYQDQRDTARIQISFSGTLHNNRREALRDVVMVRHDGAWRLERVLDGRMN